MNLLNPPITPWYPGWNIILVCLVFQALIIGTVFFSYTLAVGEWLADDKLNVTLTYVMAPITVLTLCQSIVSPLVGYALDRYSIRVMICVGAFLVSAGYIATSLVTSFFIIIVIYGTFIVVGVGLAGPLAAQTLASRWFNEKRGLAIGLVTTGTSIGGALMAPTITILYESIGWRETHRLLGIVFLLVITPLVWVIVRNSPGHSVETQQTPSAESSQTTILSQKIWTTSEILRERNFWVVVLSFLPLLFVFSSIQQHLQPFGNSLGLNSMQVAVLVSVFASVMIISKIFFGVMSDRFDHRILFALSLLVCFFVVLGFLTQSSYHAILFFTGLLGFSSGGFLPLIGAIIASRFGAASFGSVMGLVGPFLAISAFGPILFSRMYEVDGSYALAFYGALLVLCPGFLAIAFLKR